MITIGIDARTYFFRSGLGRYCRNILHAILNESKESRFVVWLSNQKTAADFPAHSGSSTEIRISQAPFGDIVAERNLLCREINESPVDVFFSPYSPVPAGVRVPRVLTIHDLTAFKFPEMHLESTVQYLKEALPECLGGGITLVADSRQTASDLAEVFPMAAPRSSVIPLGVEDRFFSNMNAEEISVVLAGYGLKSGQYLLFLGSLESRKNLPRTVRAYAGSSLWGRIPLVLAGAPRWGSEKLLRQIEECHLHSHVRILNYVSEQDLPALYRGALFFVYASLYEGFGLPVLEAMASGTAVLVSNTSSLPEVAGESALYVNPWDTEEIRAGMERLFEDASLREQLAVSGKSRAGQFTWQRAGRELLRILIDAAGN
jgi:alpha-1,3-rhamnosyl/mannosyltransferase